MKRPGEILHYGLGDIASLAARCRTAGFYATGAGLETRFGERRTGDDRGQTMFATFPCPWLADQDRRCQDWPLLQAYEGAEMPFDSARVGGGPCVTPNSPPCWASF